MAAVQAAAAASLSCTPGSSLAQSRQLLRAAIPLSPSPGSSGSKVPRTGLVCVASASPSGRGAEQHLALDVRSSSNAAVVEVDNEASDEHTVITVSADNRPGLLQLLTLTFRDLGLDVAKAVVDLDSSGRVADQFFVVDDKGSKVQKSKDIQVRRQGKGPCLVPAQ